MSIFENSFFSLAGQKERLANVGNTLLAAVGLIPGGVKSNTGIKFIDSALSTPASHPFLTAGAVTSGLTAAGKSAPAVVKSILQPAISTIGKTIAAAPIKSAIAAILGATVLKSEKGRESLASAPTAVNNFTSNLAAVIDQPSIANLEKTFKENPILASTGVAATVVAAGVGVGGALSSYLTYANTKSVKQNTAAMSAPAGPEVETSSLVDVPPVGKSYIPASATSVVPGVVAQPVTNAKSASLVSMPSRGSTTSPRKKKTHKRSSCSSKSKANIKILVNATG